MSVKISVVIPVYNAEKFLKRCMDSILSQSFKNYEIILVDDGSKDGSAVICDEYAEKYDFIRAIHKENGGASSARNAGLMNATGEYISFIDADDWLELNMYERLVSVTENSPDLVMCDFKRPVDNEGNYRNVTYPLSSGYYDREKILSEIYPCLIMHDSFDFNPLIAPWNKLYKRSFLIGENIFFDEELKFCEDELFSAVVSEKMQSFYYLKEEYLYIYYLNTNSSVTAYNPKKWEVYIELYEKTRDRFKDSADYDFTNQLKMLIIYLAVNASNNYLKCGDIGFFGIVRAVRSVFKHPYVRDGFKDFIYPNVSAKQRQVLRLVEKKCAFLYTLLFR